MLKKIIAIAIAATALPLAGQAQSYLGLSSMNYSGVHRLYLNPANAVGRANPISISIVGVGQNYDNTYADWNSDKSLLSSIIDGNEIAEENFAPRGNASNMFGVGAEVRALGATFGIGNFIGIGITSRIRSDLQVRDASLDLLEAIRTGLDDDADRTWQLDQPYTNQTLKFNTQSYGEFGLTVAGKIPIVGEGDEHRLFGGATVKYLHAIVGSSINFEELEFEVTDNAGTRELRLNKVAGTVGYSSANADQFDTENPLGEAAGKGVGVDLGMVYERKGDEEGQKYKYRFGLSIMDIGSITYDSDSSEFYRFSRIDDPNDPSDDLNIDSDEFSNDPIEVIKREFNAQDLGNSYTAYLPTTLILQGDYAVNKMFYVGAIYSRRIRTEDFSVDRGDLLAVIPRFEVRAVSVSLPVTLKNNLEEFALGTTLRAGPFYIGADNWLGALSEGNAARFNVYTGFSFNIGKPL